MTSAPTPKRRSSAPACVWKWRGRNKKFKQERGLPNPQPFFLSIRLVGLAAVVAARVSRVEALAITLFVRVLVATDLAVVVISISVALVMVMRTIGVPALLILAAYSLTILEARAIGNVVVLA